LKKSSHDTLRRLCEGESFLSTLIGKWVATGPGVIDNLAVVSTKDSLFERPNWNLASLGCTKVCAAATL
jgi:hypothetical protein